MNKLDELKDFVKGLFDKAENKDAIESLSKINSLISETEKETKELEKKNVELVKSYKDLVKHQTFEVTEGGKDGTQNEISQEVSLESCLEKFAIK